MAALSPRVVIEFCKLCSWTYEVWLNHRKMFDENPRKAELQGSLAGNALARFSIISHEYTLHQIAKLHDSAITSNKITLSIEYVVKYGGWDDRTHIELKNLEIKLIAFAENLRTVRNKLLSHNDLIAILSNSILGEFKVGDDDKYFEALQEFVNVVHMQIIGGPYPFDDLVGNDIEHFMSIIKT